MNGCRRTWLRSASAWILAACGSARAQADLLQPDEAFRVSARWVEPGVVEFQYLIAPGYHLYRDRFSFRTDPASVSVAAIDLPPALERFDPALGQKTRYYADRVIVRVRLSEAHRTVRLTATAQGCAAELGVCYPPLVRVFELPASGAGDRSRERA
jgi:thiol:disulfide interchange protein